MGRLHWPALSVEESVFGSLPNFCCPGNRIGHSDWVKLCVELNCAPNQNISSATFHLEELEKCEGECGDNFKI